MPNDQMKWRLPEELTLTRSDGCQITMKIAQHGNTLIGTANAESSVNVAGLTGAVNGSIHGDSISLTIYWPDDSVAEFDGTVGNDGLATGTTATRSGEAPANWFSAPAAWAWE